jgi:sirohydrochlorin ferrochelatase
LNKASLIIDRGSREPRVREGLENISPVFRVKAGYYHTNYCFFEVLPSFIEGIRKCREIDANLINVMPYFLFSGIRLKGFVSAVWFCSLEFGKPDTQLGIKNTLGYNPKVVILMSYFLHRGADVKRDLNDSLKKYPFENTSMTRNLAGDHKLIDFLIEHAKDVED